MVSASVPPTARRPSSVLSAAGASRSGKYGARRLCSDDAAGQATAEYRTMSSLLRVRRGIMFDLHRPASSPQLVQTDLDEARLEGSGRGLTERSLHLDSAIRSRGGSSRNGAQDRRRDDDGPRLVAEPKYVELYYHATFQIESTLIGATVMSGISCL
mmetsp:Transcript_8178/g.26802  ORF Transcript_8178/g.26802 Transcript_8178/m.26802 type:complete len:157 (+) Transcript_8178:356-826(+)